MVRHTKEVAADAVKSIVKVLNRFTLIHWCAGAAVVLAVVGGATTFVVYNTSPDAFAAIVSDFRDGDDDEAESNEVYVSETETTTTTAETTTETTATTETTKCTTKKTTATSKQTTTEVTTTTTTTTTVTSTTEEETSEEDVSYVEVIEDVPQVVVEEQQNVAAGNVEVPNQVQMNVPETVAEASSENPAVNKADPVESAQTAEMTMSSESPVESEVLTPPAIVEPQMQETTATEASTWMYGITEGDSNFILLCNAVGHEAGSNGITTANKAKVVQVICNRVDSSKYPNTIYEVLTQKNQFSGAYTYVNLGTYSSKVTDSVKDAVRGYLSGEYPNDGYTGFWGDGRQNHFR